MDIKRLINDDDAVSPVIGVILMVAITVILAAVIATFVLGLGENLSNTAPQASFSFDYDSTNSELEVTHGGGDSIPATDLYIRGGDTDTDTGSWSSTFSPGASDISAGVSVTVSNVDSGHTIRVVYQSSDGGSSATLSEWSGSTA